MKTLGEEYYTLNVRSRGKQLVLFSEMKSRETSGLEGKQN